MKSIRPVKLLVLDVDNTLTDTYRFWGAATGKALETLAEGLGLDWGTLAAAVLEAPGQYRFCDFGALLGWLDEGGHLGIAESPSDDYRRGIVKRHARQTWFDLQKRMTRFYEGVPETLQAFRDDGAAVAFYTDTEASSLIRRFWLMARNAAGRDFGRAMEIMEGVSHFYAMPSIECDRNILRDVPYEFMQAMKDRMTVWRDNMRKPSIPHMEYILRDFGVSPAEALMAGDSDKDAGCAWGDLPFAWARYGAHLSDDVVRLARQIASPEYQYGLTAVETAMRNAGSTVDATLHEGFAELRLHYRGAPGAAFNPLAQHNARTGHPCRRSFDAAAAGTSPGVRVTALSQAPPPLRSLWLPTHLPPALQGPGSPDVVYTADPGKTGLPAPSPSPAS